MVGYPQELLALFELWITGAEILSVTSQSCNCALLVILAAPLSAQLP